jgi:hypothetical protein
MRNEVVAAVVILLVIASAGAAGYFVGVSSQRTTTLVSTTTLPANYVNKNVFVINVNGSLYYADDISSDTVVQNPGYTYFRNTSVAFDGVKFETVCPQEDLGCPVLAGNKTTQTVTVMLGVYQFKMTFPNGTTVTTGSAIGDLTYTYAISNGAGMLIEYVEYNYPNNFLPYHVFLLVSVQSSCGPFGCDQSTTTMTCFATPTNATTMVTISNSTVTHMKTATSSSTAIYGCTSLASFLPLAMAKD